MNKKITIGYLYPEYMNIYGDTGNIITLKYRAQARNIDIAVKEISLGTTLHSGEIDIYFFGGGQDEQQIHVSQDIQRFGQIITEDINNGAAALTICGGYQLFGRFYRPFEGEDLKGIGIFSAETTASNVRMINNLVVSIEPELIKNIKKIYNTDRDIPATLVGFENHSGQTLLDPNTTPLGKTISGYGNNETKQFEGCQYKNAFGTYMHGSLLPKNPHFADYLIVKALEHRYKEEVRLTDLPDQLEYQAHNEIVNKFHS